MYIDVVCDVHISTSQQSGENLHIHPFVITIRRKSVSEHMLSPVRHKSILTHVRAALTDERSARRPSPCAPARRTSFVRDWFFFCVILRNVLEADS